MTTSGSSCGATIELFIARVPALNAAPQDDPLVVIAGGPGQAATDFYPPVRAAFEPIRRDRDILLIDQRGTGRSAPLALRRQCIRRDLGGSTDLSVGRRSGPHLVVGTSSQERALAQVAVVLLGLGLSRRLGFSWRGIAVRFGCGFHGAFWTSVLADHPRVLLRIR